MKIEKIVTVALFIVIIYLALDSINENLSELEEMVKKQKRDNLRYEYQINELEQHTAELEKILSEKPQYGYKPLPVYADGIFKSYMDGSAITDTSSKAYKQLQSLYIDENGIYCDGEYKAVALARFYGSVGDRFRITLESGQTFKAVMTDTKQDIHVDSNYADENGAIVEFVVDIPSLPDTIRSAGSLDGIYQGPITKIEREE